MQIMHSLADEIGDAFIAAHEKLTNDEMALRA
jgi:hypothetical protein